MTLAFRGLCSNGYYIKKELANVFWFGFENGQVTRIVFSTMLRVVCGAMLTISIVSEWSASEPTTVLMMISGVGMSIIDGDVSLMK
jgi:hypothetical protein